jgi:intein/homing endonuclease
MRAFCSLLGLFLAEGWVRSDRDDIIISQYPTSRHLPEIKAILAATGLHWPYDERNSKFTASSKALADWLRENAGKRAWGKHVPDGFLNLDADLLNALLRGMMIGDGHWGPQGQRYYTTTSLRFADEVQEIFQKVGADAWIRPQDLNKYGGGSFGGSRRISYVVRERMQEAHMLPKSVLREYHGSVYDVTVPNPTVYVRRNGRAVWA